MDKDVAMQIETEGRRESDRDRGREIDREKE